MNGYEKSQRVYSGFYDETGIVAYNQNGNLVAVDGLDKNDDGTSCRVYVDPRTLVFEYDQPSPINPDDLIQASEYADLVDDSEVINGLTVYQLEDGRTVTVEYDGSLTVNSEIEFAEDNARQPLKLGGTMIEIPMQEATPPVMGGFSIGDRVRWNGIKSEVLGTVTGFYEPYNGPTSGPQAPLVVVDFDGYENEIHCDLDEITLAAIPTAEEKAKADADIAITEAIAEATKNDLRAELIDTLQEAMLKIEEARSLIECYCDETGDINAERYALSALDDLLGNGNPYNANIPNLIKRAEVFPDKKWDEVD